MDYSRFRNLTLEELSKIHEQAMLGEPEAIQGFVYHSIWEKLLKVAFTKNCTYKELIEFSEGMMEKIKITLVDKNGR